MTSTTQWTIHFSDLSAPAFVSLENIVHDFAKQAVPTIPLNFIGKWHIYVRGYMIRDNVRWKDVINQICQLWGITFVESDGGWKFRLTNADADFVIDRVIPASALIESSGGVGVTGSTNALVVQGTRRYEADIPLELQVSYVDFQSVLDTQLSTLTDHVYNVSTQSYRRPNAVFTVTDSNRTETISIPIIMDADTALGLAMQALYRFVTAQDVALATIAPEHGDIEPGDIISIPDNDFVHTGKVTESKLNNDFTNAVTVTGYPAEQAIQATSADGAPILEGPPSDLGTSGTGVESFAGSGIGSRTNPLPRVNPPSPNSQYIHLDTGLLNFTDDLGGTGLVQYHMLSGRGQPVWPGAHLWRSATGANDYSDVAQTTGVYPTLAATLNVLPPPPMPWSTDYTTQLVIRVTAGSPSDFVNANWDEITFGQNVLAVGAPGRWELIQYQVAVANPDGTITLSTLSRGRRGTDYFWDQHEAGDRVVCIRTAYVRELDYPTSALDQTFFYKTLGLGQILENVLAQTNVVSGAAEKPYRPIDLATLRLSGGDILLSANPRTRLDGRWISTAPFPLGEQYMQMEWDIYGSAGTVIRTIVGTQFLVYSAPQTAIYTAAMQVADGFDLSILEFGVYQMSATVGRGYPAFGSFAV